MAVRSRSRSRATRLGAWGPKSQSSKGPKTREPNAGLGCVMYWVIGLSAALPGPNGNRRQREKGKEGRNPCPCTLHPVSCIPTIEYRQKGCEDGEKVGKYPGLGCWRSHLAVSDLDGVQRHRSCPHHLLPRLSVHGHGRCSRARFGGNPTGPTLAIRHVLPHGCKWSGLRSTWAGRTGLPTFPLSASPIPP